MAEITAETVAAQAERVAQQRALADTARRIADPRLRAEVEALAAGTTSTAEFVRFVDTSPQAWRGLHRTVSTYLALTDDQRIELVDRYRQQTASIQAELGQSVPASTSGHQDAPETRADESWETRQSWLE